MNISKGSGIVKSGIPSVRFASITVRNDASSVAGAAKRDDYEPKNKIGAKSEAIFKREYIYGYVYIIC